VSWGSIPVELAMANRVIRERVNRKFMNDGITIVDPETNIYRCRFRIGEETVVYPNTFIETAFVIGRDAR
jgi:bifunctional UDP-N-acetylglucosamine pyrophosphorylase/glucosamine-1-phosphate N-acetyltransferase